MVNKAISQDNMQQVLNTIYEDMKNISGATSYISQKSPVGSIISYMGLTAPDHYLICDGNTYNIIDFPVLAKHFLNEFGSYNYFGGDGVTTFAVPDLRGEFLRGSGTATRDTGSGENVGIHQDPTGHLSIYVNEESPQLNYYANKTGVPDNRDKLIGASTNGKRITSTNYTASNRSMYYSSRPTNTSVLYCIKYKESRGSSRGGTLDSVTLWEGIASSVGNCTLSESTKNFNFIAIEARTTRKGATIDSDRLRTTEIVILEPTYPIMITVAKVVFRDNTTTLDGAFSFWLRLKDEFTLDIENIRFNSTYYENPRITRIVGYR